MCSEVKHRGHVGKRHTGQTWHPRPPQGGQQQLWHQGVSSSFTASSEWSLDKAPAKTSKISLTNLSQSAVMSRAQWTRKRQVRKFMMRSNWVLRAAAVIHTSVVELLPFFRRATAVIHTRAKVPSTVGTTSSHLVELPRMELAGAIIITPQVELQRRDERIA